MSLDEFSSDTLFMLGVEANLKYAEEAANYKRDKDGLSWTMLRFWLSELDRIRLKLMGRGVRLYSQLPNLEE